MSDRRCFMENGVLKCSDDVFNKIRELSVNDAGRAVIFGATRIIVLSSDELDALDAKFEALEAIKKAPPHD